MRPQRYGIYFLTFLNCAMAAVLGWLWLTPAGELRNVRWQAPEALKQDVLTLLPSPMPDGKVDVSQFLGALERPLFSPTRRPPLPPPPPVIPPPPPPPDPLATLHLYGVVAGGDTGGIIAKIDGKTRRVRFGETVGLWTLKSINDRNVTFVRGAETRVVPLLHARSNAVPILPSVNVPMPAVPAVPAAGVWPSLVPASPSGSPATAQPSSSVPAVPPVSAPATAAPAGRSVFSIGGRTR